MENFDLIKLIKHNTKDLLLTATHCEQYQNTVYYIKNSKLYVHNVKDEIENEIIINKSLNEVIRLKFIITDLTLCIVTKKQIILYDTINLKVVDENTFENSIAAISWNSSETVAIVMFEDGEITQFFHNEFDVKHNTINIDAAVPKFIQLGWGSENTQFRGKRRPTGAQEPEEPKEVIENKSPKISWRGNGEQFAINYYNDGQRIVKVFDKNCQPLYQTEPYKGLQEIVEFKEEGNMIACISRVDNKNTVVIFEKNCKERFKFDIPEVPGKVVRFIFHKTVQILVIQSTHNNSCFFSFYFHYNGQWYLKQQLHYPLGHNVLKLIWLETPTSQTLAFNVITNKEIVLYQYRLLMQRNKLSGVYGVIDGSKLNLTFFSKQLQPPPLNTIEFKMDQPINKIEFHQTSELCAIFDVFFNVKIIQYSENKIEVIEHIKFEGGNLPLDSPYIYWHIKDTFEVYFLNGKPELIGETEKVNVIVKTTEKELLPFSDTNVEIPENLIQKENSVNCIYLTGEIVDDEFYTFSLTDNSHFFINDVLISNAVTSIFVYNQYLLITVLTNRMYCVRLKKLHLDDLITSKSKLDNYFSRNIEQGSKILCVSKDNAQVILFLPRGNIECITCRLITIDLIEKYLSNQDWNKAMYTIRIHKLNPNLLIDLNPQRFLDNIDKFVIGAERTSNLNIFCREFSKLNCLETLYSKCVEIETKPVNKIEIFKKILEHLQEKFVAHLSTIALLNQKHFSLKNALLAILNLFEVNPRESAELCHKVVKQILLYSNKHDLYRESLKLYNVEFVAFIAECCSIDPKVFRPEMENLRKLKPVEQRFLMNVMANNMGQAVPYLIRCENYDITYIKNFILKHNLAEIAYKSCVVSSEHFPLVTRLYANQLTAKRQFEEAGFILKRSNQLEEALEQYKRSLNTQQIILIMQRLNFDPEKQRNILNELATDLIKADKVLEAANIYETILKDYAKAIDVLVESKFLSQAMTVAVKYGYTSAIDNIIKPANRNNREILFERINELRDNFLNRTERLQVVRTEKWMKVKQRSRADYVEISDIYSEYGSTISKSSKRSSKSSSSRRRREKEQRRKIDLRIGGVYEDIALMRNLHLLITEAAKLGNEVRELCLLAEDDESYKHCQDLHKNLVTLHKVMIEKVPEIWPKIIQEHSQSTDAKDIAIVENLDALDLKYRTPPVDLLDMEWKLSIFLE